MKFVRPRNGSFSANLLILLLGGVAGSGVTWSLRPGGLFGISPVVVETVPKSQPSAFETASTRKSGVTRMDKPEITQATLEQMGALDRSEYFRGLGADAALDDLANALEQADAMTSKRDQLDFLRGLYSEWAENDPEGALSYAQSKFPAGTLQSELIGLAMNKWAYEHPREAWLWAQAHLEGPLKERALNDLIIGWTRQSPADAAKWLMDSGLTSSGLFTALPRTWAETDPAAALDWVRGLPAGKAKDLAEIAVADSYAADDPPAAVAAFDAEIQRAANADLIVALTNRWAATDPAAVAQWVNQLGEGQARLEAAATLATVWAASDVQAAVNWSQTISDTALRQQVISHLATTWGAIEPHKALEWLGSLPPDQAAEGTRGAFYSWAATDPLGLEQWIGEMGAGSLGDQGRRSLADVRSQSDPASAMNLALGLSSPEVRDDVVARYYRKWAATQQADAGDWYDMNASKLPPTTRDRLSKEVGKNPPPQVPAGRPTPAVIEGF